MMWVSPADSTWISDRLGPDPIAPVSDLVLAMKDTGLFSVEGLLATLQVWEPVSIDDNTHVKDLVDINLQVMRTLQPKTLNILEVGRATKHVVQRWSFPLDEFPLSKMADNYDDIREQQARFAIAFEEENIW